MTMWRQKTLNRAVRGEPYQVNFNQDYLLMEWYSGWIKANTWLPLLSRDRKTISGVWRHHPDERVKHKHTSKAHLQESATSWLHVINVDQQNLLQGVTGCQIHKRRKHDGNVTHLYNYCFVDANKQFQGVCLCQLDSTSDKVLPDPLHFTVKIKV